MAKTKRLFIIYLAVLICLLAVSCVIVHHDDDNGVVIGSAVIQAVDAAGYIEDYWDSYILPEIYERRVALARLINTVASSGWEFAGETYGEIRGDIGASYNFIVYGAAIVREINTESRNGFIVIEIEGLQTGYETRISIGPAFSGSAIRDSIRFIDFNHFVNQVDFARLSSELNRFGNENIHASVDVMELTGKTIEFTGSFTEPGGSDVISIMPIFMEEV